jgi:hypothetical protein
LDKLKPFAPGDLDTSLLRVVLHGDVHFALFPYVDATSNVPEFKSVTHRLIGEQITFDDMRQLTALIEQRGQHMTWAILFSTPWLVRPDADKVREHIRR